MEYFVIVMVFLAGIFCGFLLGRQNRRSALQDPLTGLPNKPAFNKHLETLLDDRSRNHPCSILFLDIDHFKQINDRLGHLAGDEVLRQLATLLSKTCQPGSVFRWGGDEFTILSFGSKEAVQQLAQQIQQAIGQLSTTFQQQPALFTVSIGAAQRNTSEAGSELLKRADQALYEAKSSGRDQICWSDSTSDAGKTV